MDLTADESPEKVMLQQCRFPTSAHTKVEERHYELMSAFDDDTVQSALGKSFESSKQFVLTAWAVLLRSYLRNDTITFVVLSDIMTFCPCQNDTKTTSLGVQNEARILQFHIPNECRLKDIHAIVAWPCTRQALETTSISTAVNLLSPSPLINGLQNANISWLTNHHEFDLILNVTSTPSVSVSISYQWPTISEPYARAIMNSFRKAVTELASNNECIIGEIDFVSKEDKRKMMLWNPETPYAQMNCLHYLVEATARTVPDSEAVCAWDGSLTYAQLDQLSTSAAKLLSEAGVGRGMYVPFAYEKSLWTVIATLAILKAGAAFVPLDPLHPTARLKEILSSIHTSVIVTSSSLASTFVGLVKHVVIISAGTIFTHQHDQNNGFRHADTSPTDPIFVLFTSGSTGKPKAMIHEHGAICTHAITHGKAMGYHGARVLQFAAHTFDVAIIDIFTTLIFGGAICIPSEEDRRNDIVGAINNMGADYAILTPSFAGLIDPSEVPTLRTLAIGGEPLPQDHIERWAEKVSLIQIYGPAEVGICLIMPMHSRTHPETVGYTLRNSSCWLVDPDDPNRLVPIGAVGELAVAGPSLARGYLNNEAKTRLSFRENLSWAQELGLKCQRFYLTGDLLRMSTSSFDGCYDFVGRKDNQIKLRGQRIEPGEIEYYITRIRGVATSILIQPKQGCFAGELVTVVQMCSTESKTFRRLDEPISLAPDQSLSIGSLRKQLSRNLPSFMIPAVCLNIVRMPVVPSLKMDRRLVGAWLANMQSRPSEMIHPTMLDLQTSKLDNEEITANILSLKVAGLVACNDIVKRSMLEHHDFRLQHSGIDSIQIISLSMFLQKQYEVRIPMDTLFSSKVTIRHLAFLVDHRDQPSMTPTTSTAIDVIHESRHLSAEMFRKIGAQSSHRQSKRHFQVQNIFLTGASGYLGSAILQHLMATPKVHVYALVRCSKESAGLQYIIDAATKTGWWQEAFRSRIHVWQGDLTEPSLGLHSQQLQCLQGVSSQENHSIHAIIHNGARVHYSSDYETLKPPNVFPTLELMQITALSTTISAFVYVSGGQKPNAFIQDPASCTTSPPLLSKARASTNGYTSSKIISELIIRNCASHPSFFQHARLYTLKPGYIIGTSVSGIANTRDFIWRLIAACVEIGACNADEAMHWLFIADASCVARSAVAGIFDHRYPSGYVERVLNGLLFADLWALLREEFGYALEPVTHEAWMGRLKARIGEAQEAHGLFPLLHVLERDGGNIGEERVAVDEAEAEAEAEAERGRESHDARAGAGAGAEARDRAEEATGAGAGTDPVVRGGEVGKSVKRNVEYLIEVGFLPRPRRADGAEKEKEKKKDA